ncbi:zinc-dependent alcohol dehydrogenase family protein [Streptomyces sp. NPDC054933]
MDQWLMRAGVSQPRDLVLRTVERPEPGPGQVRVRVRAVSVNQRDWLVLRGMGRLPGQDLVPLSDVAGDIDAVGTGVTGWSIGDRVTNVHFQGWDDGPVPDGLGFGMGALAEQGVLAEYVVLPADRIARAPRNLDHAEAATLPVAGVTAWHALSGTRPVVSSCAARNAARTVMVIGTGGVSVFTVQLARAVGARVFAAVRQPAKGERLRELGVECFVDSTTTPEWGQAVRRASDGGVDVAVDTVGTATLNQSLTATGSGGEVALVGLFEQQPPVLDGTLLFGRTIRGVAVGSTRMHRDLVAAVETHDIHPVVDNRIPFADAPAAFEALASHGVFGKIVIEVG